MLDDMRLDNILDNAIFPTIKTGKNLLDCFRQIDELNISSNDCVQRIKLFALNSDKFVFDYDGLKKLIRNNVANYVLNRKAYQQAVTDDELQRATLEASLKLIKIQKDAIEKKNYGSGGELGEILLYIFFEGFLKAKKLLSKVEIKTNNKDYVKGFDGIHFLVKEYENHKAYQLVYGEAKIIANINKAVDEAFESLSACFANRETDLKLLDSKFFDEIATTDEETLEFLKAIIIPSYRSANSSIETENAFGIFIGYTFETPQAPTKTPKIKINEKIKKDIDGVKQKIITKVQQFANNSDFYLFFLPFNDATKDKSSIMLDILGGR